MTYAGIPSPLGDFTEPTDYTAAGPRPIRPSSDKNASQPSTSGSGLLTSVWGLPALTLGSNLAGGVIVIALIVFSGAPERIGPPVWTLVIILVATITATLASGALALTMLRRRSTSWITQRRSPTPREASHILRLPLHTSLVVAALWVCGIATMTASALQLAPPTEAIRGAVLSTLAALASVGYNYLFVDRAIRPAMAQSLLSVPRTHIPHSSVMTRLTVSWLLSTALPLLAALILLHDTAANPTDRIRAATWLAVVALLAGVIVELVLARAVALPLRHLRVALEKMGSADINIPVDDSSEIGLLQSTVNEMSRALDERHRLHELFARHVGRHVAARAVAGDQVGGESRNVTALFVDVRDSTTMANLHSTHDLVAKLNRLFSDVIAATERRGGLVNKFQGDAALCIFGAPRDLDDDATAALQTARKVRDDTLHHAELDIGIGLDKGIVFAGNLGTEQRLEYTVIGDTVNQAARLSDLAKRVPGRILATDTLIQAATLQERQHWRPHNAYTLRGRPTPTPTWTNVVSQGAQSHGPHPDS